MVWPTTLLSKKLGIKFPIIQAPMAGGITTPALIAAVSNAGGLGSLGAGYMSADDIQNAIRQIRTLTSNPFAINLFIPTAHHATLDDMQVARDVIERAAAELKINIDLVNKPFVPNFEEQVEVIVKEKIAIFSFTFECLDEYWITKFKDTHTALIGTATTLAEARLLEEQGADIIVAQGNEAGGHRGSFLDVAENSLIALSNLIPQLVDKINIPIVAAGGIMDGKAIVTALRLGASGVQMGTAFLCCDESGAHAAYQHAVLNTHKDNTVLTRAFSGKLARGICNKFITRMAVHQNDILQYPIQNALTSTMRKKAQATGCIDFMSMWAGQSVELCRQGKAKVLMKKLIDEVERAL